MFSNTAKKKGSIRTAPWWPIVQFSSLIRSDSEKSNRLHQQFTQHSIHHVQTGLSGMSTAKMFAFPLNRWLPHFSMSVSTGSVSVSCSHHPTGPKAPSVWGTRDQLELTAFFIAHCQLADFFSSAHRLENRAQNIEGGFFSGDNNKKEDSWFTFLVVFLFVI